LPALSFLYTHKVPSANLTKQAGLRHKPVFTCYWKFLTADIRISENKRYRQLAALRRYKHPERAAEHEYTLLKPNIPRHTHSPLLIQDIIQDRFIAYSAWVKKSTGIGVQAQEQERNSSFMKRIVMLLTVMALMSAMLVAGIGGPASAQVNLSPTVNAPILSNDKIAAQCIASPLLGTPSPTLVLPGAGGGDQCTQSQ
jgi:hypothetical protein